MFNSLWKKVSDVFVDPKKEASSPPTWGQRFAQFFGFSQNSGWNQEVAAQIQQHLLSSDFGPALTQECLDLLSTHQPKTPQEALDLLHGFLYQEISSIPLVSQDKDVFFIIGVNGAGKTTTAAKLTYLFQEKKPLLIAADTYRAAAVAQLQSWADRLETLCFSSEAKDPSAVIYEGLGFAENHHHSPVIVDTSGRLQTDKNLVQELVKMKKTAQKKLTLPQRLRTVLVLDGTQGQNILQQVETFHQALGLDSLIITKLDGQRRSGIVCAVMKKYRLPVDFIGRGEKPQDLVSFEPSDFLKDLLGGSV